MRCPHCGSLQTVKNGVRPLIDNSLERKSKKNVQRYKCKTCSKRFVKKKNKERYTMKLKIELARMHVEERMSYRVMRKRIKEQYFIRISKNTICRMVNQIAKMSKGDIKIREEYRPNWEGYLTVDDKYFSVGGKKKLILTATDSSGDFIHTEIFKEVEQQGIDEFMRFIKERLRYPIKGVTTDLDEMLEKSIEKVFGKEVPHQQCLKHALDIVDRIIELKQKRRAYENALKNKTTDCLEKKDKYVEAEKIMGLSRRMFYSSDKKQSMKIFDELKIYKAKYPKLIAFFYRSLEKLFTHHKHPLIKKTNNIAENINRQLMRRFKTIESFQKLIYAENYLNLYKNYLRFKPYTDCRGSHKYKNGKSPLEVCGVVLKNKDWLYNAIAF
jgi:transposase-like protein